MVKGKFFKEHQETFFYYPCYDYDFFGEHLKLTKPKTSIRKLIKYAIQQKTSRHCYLAYRENRFLSKLWIKILSPIEFKLREIIK